MEYLPYGNVDKPVQAWDVLENEYQQHTRAASDCRRDIEATEGRLTALRDSLLYHERGAEECRAAAEILRSQAGFPPAP